MAPPGGDAAVLTDISTQLYPDTLLTSSQTEIETCFFLEISTHVFGVFTMLNLFGRNYYKECYLKLQLND